MPVRARFDVYGRMQLLLEQDGRSWRAYVLGSDGKRRTYDELQVPDGLPVDALAAHLDEILHELGGPGRSVTRIG